MTTGTNSGNQAKEKVRVSKMVVIKLMNDGSSQVVNVDSATEDGLEIKISGGKVATSKDFTELPKRLAFFFEKGFNY